MNWVIGLILVAIIVGVVLSYLAHAAQDEKRIRERARAAILRYEQVDEFRLLDIQIAEAFRLYVSMEWQKNYRQPTGIPRTNYDHRAPANEKYRESIPYYSTKQSDYAEFERYPMVTSLRSYFLKLLVQEGLDENSATLEQKCKIWLKAKTGKPSNRS